MVSHLHMGCGLCEVSACVCVCVLQASGVVSVSVCLGTTSPPFGTIP